MDLLSMLPLLKGWRYDPKDLQGQVYRERTQLVNVQDERGWFMWALAAFSNPNAAIRVTYDGTYTADITPRELFTSGLLTSNSGGFWVGTYSIPLSFYTIFFTPNYPWPFRKSLVIEIEPPSGQTVTLLDYGHLLIRVDDDAAFEQSLKAVLGT